MWKISLIFTTAGKRNLQFTCPVFSHKWEFFHNIISLSVIYKYLYFNLYHTHLREKFIEFNKFNTILKWETLECSCSHALKNNTKFEVCWYLTRSLKFCDKELIWWRLKRFILVTLRQILFIFWIMRTETKPNEYVVCCIVVIDCYKYLFNKWSKIT